MDAKRMIALPNVPPPDYHWLA